MRFIIEKEKYEGDFGLSFGIFFRRKAFGGIAIYIFNWEIRIGFNY
jgi:hypothetical protein